MGVQEAGCGRETTLNRQSVIPSSSSEELTFASFHVGVNLPLVQALEMLSEGKNPGAAAFFWGPSGSGKSHLLEACCHKARERGRRYHFVSGIAPPPSPESGALVCLDDVGIGTVDPAQELGWLSLYELLRQGEGNLIVAASKPPADLGLSTPDLVSRLSSGGVFHLQPVGDKDKRYILANRAQQRGFDLPEQVIEYIMRHHARDAASLFSLLDRLDHASLSQHRRITVPFLRDLLNN